MQYFASALERFSRSRFARQIAYFSMVIAGNDLDERRISLDWSQLHTGQHRIHWFNRIGALTFHRILVNLPSIWGLFFLALKFNGWNFIKGEPESYQIVCSNLFSNATVVKP